MLKRCIWYGGSIEWNSLDADNKHVVEHVQFKRVQKSLMLKTYLN